MKDYPVNINEIMRARAAIRPYLPPAPFRRYPDLSRLLGFEVSAKLENRNPGGCYKPRGGINLARQLVSQGIRGVTTYSTGNHGLSVASSARLFGLKAVVVVPEGANPVKCQAIRDAGAELVEAGTNFDQAGRRCIELSEEQELYMVHPANEPFLINGVGTGFLEVIEDEPDIDVMIVPLGAGSEASGAVTVFRALKPKVKIIAVQAEAASAAHDSWETGHIVESSNTTFAGGVATGTAYELPYSIYAGRQGLDDFILLSEDQMYKGIALAAHHCRELLEGAGSASLAAAILLRDQLAGKKVVLQFSGGNASPAELAEAYRREVLFTGEFD
jgi:threonine dehydratase